MVVMILIVKLLPGLGVMAHHFIFFPRVMTSAQVIVILHAMMKPHGVIMVSTTIIRAHGAHILMHLVKVFAPFLTVTVVTGCTEVCAGVLDCAGECGGTAVVDCAGVCGGSSALDGCQVCNRSGIPEGDGDCNGNVLDCAGVCGGSDFPSAGYGLLEANVLCSFPQQWDDQDFLGFDHTPESCFNASLNIAECAGGSDFYV